MANAVLEKAKELGDLCICYELKVRGLQNSNPDKLLVSAQVKEIDQHYLLMLVRPTCKRAVTYLDYEFFGIAETYKEADEKAYKELKERAPTFMKPYGFFNFVDLTKEDQSKASINK